MKTITSKKCDLKVKNFPLGKTLNKHPQIQ